MALKIHAAAYLGTKNKRQHIDFSSHVLQTLSPSMVNTNKYYIYSYIIVYV